jgi:hypothetical protein
MKMIENEGDIIYATERGSIVIKTCTLECCTSVPKKICQKPAKETSCKSTVLCSVINTFGESKGFDRMIAAIERSDTSLEVIHDFVVFLSGAVDVYHKSFVDQYFEKLSTAIELKLLSAKEDQLRKFDKVMLDDLERELWGSMMERLWDDNKCFVHKMQIKAKIACVFLK